MRKSRKCNTRHDERRITLGGDKAYDVAAFVGDLRHRKVIPHIAIDGNIWVTGTPRSTTIDTRITRHQGCAISQMICEWVKGSLAGASRSMA